MTGARGVRALAIALTLSLGFVVTPGSVLPAHAEPAAVRTLLTDVDGDGTYDSVQLFDLGSDAYRLTVTTTAAATSSVDFTARLDADLDAKDTLYGTAPLDGVKGSELIVCLWDRELTSYRENVEFTVYTWRSGGLVAEKAPASSYLHSWHFGGAPQRGQGYRFFTQAGRRYVDVTGVRFAWPHWTGKVTRSVWRNGQWVKVSTRTVRNRLYGALWYSGPPVLLGQASVDIDGDNAADELRYYRSFDNGVGDGIFKVKVTTATGKVVARSLQGETDPLLGAADVDGVPGDDLVFETASDDPDWRVITWRKGTLVDEPAPAMCGRPPGGRWEGCGNEATQNLTFSVSQGTHYVVAGELNDGELTGKPGYEARYVESVWRNGAWVKVLAWTADFTDKQAEAFGRGLHGLTFTKP